MARQGRRDDYPVSFEDRFVNDKVQSGPYLLAVATQGSGGDDEQRLRTLLAPFGDRVSFYPFDRRSKYRSFLGLLREAKRARPDLLVMEGTGLAGGLALLAARTLHGIPYVVSSGDAVGPFVGARVPLAGPIFSLYEKWLYRFASGFIGWSPYLTGRALTFGTPRAMTAAGWAPFPSPDDRQAACTKVRAHLGIPEQTLVVGIVGSLAWNARFHYCYGLELVEAMRRTGRPDVAALIVGDGEGRGHLEHLAGTRLGRSIFLAGRVPREQVPEYLAAFDMASLPQSVDGVGCFRYTTKLSEYLAAGLPVVTGQIPLAYDLDDGWIWRLPGPTPWHSVYIDALTALLGRITPSEIASRRAAVVRDRREFDREAQVARVVAFMSDLIDSRGRHKVC
jgi:glycosyltransferase involved in cell wall biosynthesis